MALSGTRVTVTDAATLIRTADTDGHSTVVVRNPGANDVDLGGADVTSGGGFVLAAGDQVVIDLGPAESLYGICDATLSQSVELLITGE